LNHNFFVGLLDTFGEEHPEYLTEAVKAAWSKFVTSSVTAIAQNPSFPLALDG
jgi:hypothetical protein